MTTPNRSPGKINKIVASFVILVTIIGVTAFIWMICNHQLRWQTMLFTAIYAYISALSITAGYHRLFSHKTYQAHPVITFIFTLIGTSSFEGSVIEWCTDHRNHHRYSDTDMDPYSITRGFWHAHMGWLLRLDQSKRDFSNVTDLTSNKMLMFFHKYFIAIAIFTGFLFPTLFAGLLWGDWIGGFFIAGVFRIAVNQQSTFCINSVCHMFGKRPYNKVLTACDNWITALVTTGEGYHNFHHQFPLDYRNGVRFYQYDPAKWLIKLLSYMGLTSNLHRQTKPKILQYKIKQEMSQWIVTWSDRSQSIKVQLEDMIQPLKQTLLSKLSLIDSYEKDINKIKSSLRTTKENAILNVKTKYLQAQKELQHYQGLLKHANKELKIELRKWKKLMRKEPIRT